MLKQLYVDKYWKAAQDACAGTPIFPLLALAESAVESGWGGSQLAIQANNMFGVKAFSSWKGKTITMHTREYKPDGTPYFIDAPFRAYDDVTDSFKDYVSVVENARYIAKGVNNATTIEEQIADIEAGGYSTSPTYAATIISVANGLKEYLP